VPVRPEIEPESSIDDFRRWPAGGPRAPPWRDDGRSGVIEIAAARRLQRIRTFARGDLHRVAAGRRHSPDTISTGTRGAEVDPVPVPRPGRADIDRGMRGETLPPSAGRGNHVNIELPVRIRGERDELPV